ncbi:hypothetical protein ACG95P_12985 [Acinetobacter guillouiae]|uniref:hypothetical protein n=1 Tax=Acinetobacter guillouiae TaxID=106649 RepID=UPI003AF968D3
MNQSFKTQLDHAQGVAELATSVISSFITLLESQDIDISDVECSVCTENNQQIGNKITLRKLTNVVLDELNTVKVLEGVE